jgi:hypothetical protein
MEGPCHLLRYGQFFGRINAAAGQSRHIIAVRIGPREPPRVFESWRTQEGSPVGCGPVARSLTLMRGRVGGGGASG